MINVYTIKLCSRILQQTRYARWVLLPKMWLYNYAINMGGKIVCEMMPNRSLVLRPEGI